MPEAGSPIAARLQSLASEQIGDLRVADVRIGLKYTAVALEDGSLGLALTPVDCQEHSCWSFGDRSPMMGRPGVELLAGLSSRVPGETALGLACANAVFNRSGAPGTRGDVLDMIAPRPEDRVVMVGHFQPVVRRLQGQVASLAIFDLHVDQGPDVRPAEEVFSALPYADVALITATTLINHTLDPILQAAGHCRQVALLGASTPMVPVVFASGPISLLSGVHANQIAEILQTVSEGGGMAVFKKYVNKINLKVTRP